MTSRSVKIKLSLSDLDKQSLLSTMQLFMQVFNFYTKSQICSNCGSCNKKSRKKGRYDCITCGHREHADLNASKNIRDRYLDNPSFAKKQMQAPVNEPNVSLSQDTSLHPCGVGSWHKIVYSSKFNVYIELLTTMFTNYPH